ncbi:hypothetical protein ASF10_00875 [Flavobacterium sp. Leaf82]|nr:hypothetical protein ASF10_00875 [Flavobacterium sp. Leaf82]
MINIFGFICIVFRYANITFSQIFLLLITTNYKFNNDKDSFLDYSSLEYLIFLPQSALRFLN